MKGLSNAKLYYQQLKQRLSWPVSCGSKMTIEVTKIYTLPFMVNVTVNDFCQHADTETTEEITWEGDSLWVTRCAYCGEEE